MNPGRLLLFCWLGFMLCMEVVADERQVVLVAAADSPLHSLDALELRKLYLGFTVVYEGKIIRGFRHSGDDELNHIFLQTVVAMSERAYKRRLLSLTLRQGIPRPAEYDDTVALTAALSANPYSVSYMWKDTAERLLDVKILRVLWQQY